MTNKLLPYLLVCLLTEQVTGASNLTAALDAVRTQVFNGSAPRQNVWKVTIVITDQLQPSQALSTAITGARSSGILMFGVGIRASGRQIDDNTLYELSFQPYVNQYQATFVSGGYDDLDDSVQPLMSFSCVNVTVYTTPPTPVPNPIPTS